MLNKNVLRLCLEVEYVAVSLTSSDTGGKLVAGQDPGHVEN